MSKKLTLQELKDRIQSDPLYYYVLVRRDLSVGAQVAQATHAMHTLMTNRGVVPDDSKAVVLGVKNEKALLVAFHKLTDALMESDAETVGWSIYYDDFLKEYTAMVVPGIKEQDRELFVEYDLL